ncbi:cytochrome c biogenesis protein [Corynebacterium kutscheri]|uniref:Cytochrome c biogenesis protein n=1 Tax=Corynebacterium kutscheri TaxID=35755 RepID=A0A0F6QZ35_9CORY|nr:c-type cytochrome biogenesis protein CcsB [Corynebacterium kutscheri]AKE40495.1 cytochrome c-type biogenesis protein CcsB [Corynebacterium kutscheri]VEH05089.1 cytochrome c biogenesis protein [Corynebacterium kutscheri]VEH10890.1 cytochrome c biogenesis protein [Corynebacterium kutscheri]VEH80633.1 cytochrome c biogenesis protein [Corynebacterium kutscheri]
MNVNSNLAQLSDWAFASALVIYFIALILSIIYYMKARTLIDTQREQMEINQEVLVHTDSAGPTMQTSNAQERIVEKEASAEKFAGMTQTMVWLGVLVHLASVILRALSASRFPFGNLYEYILVITVLTMIVAAIYLVRRDLRIMWTWVLTPVLALLLVGGTKLYADSAPLVPALKSNWLSIHVSTVATGASIGIISGIASVLYLLRMYQPVGQEHGSLGSLIKPLPSAKILDMVAYRTAILAVPIFGLGIVLGAIWAEAAWGRYWNWDPKETGSFITWILYAAYLHARATAGWRNIKAAWINIFALATMLFNIIVINTLVSGLHSYAGLN